MPIPTLPSVGISGSSPARIECRVRPRHACDLKASCQPVAARSHDDLHWAGTIRDISTAGIGLVLKRRFEPGAGLAIEVPPAEDGVEQTLLARVRHATRMPDGRWLLGCAFISELSDDELRTLLRLSANTEEANPPENGKPTLPVVTEVTFRGTDEDGRPVAILVKRLQPSPGWPLAAGTALALRVGPASTKPVRLIVQESSQKDGQWVVRCRFLGAPRAEVAQALAAKTRS